MWKQVEDKELEEFTRAEQGLLSQDSILSLNEAVGRTTDTNELSNKRTPPRWVCDLLNKHGARAI